MKILFKYASSISVSLVMAAVVVFLTASCETGPDLSKVNNSPANTNTASAEQELSGEYILSGLDENGSDPYDGVLTISDQGDAYRFYRQTKVSRLPGVGVQMGDSVAVTYAEADKGKGCGVALYRISSDGRLDGKIALWGEYKFGTEKAVQLEGNSFDGKYSVTGTTSDGTPYDGTIKVEKIGDGHFITWTTTVREFVGFGIWRGDRAAFIFGGKQCTLALYKVAGRSLEGHWGSQRDITFGTETAKRQ